MSESILLESTADGSHTLYVPELDEHYHSTNGAIQESKHIFIEAGLNAVGKENISILEIGFGTGLNALLTIANSKGMQINYHSFETTPLPLSLIETLNYPNCIDENLAEIFAKMHEVKWDVEEEITPSFQLTKTHADFSSLTYTYTKKYDLIYFDAFAPNKQEEMWSQAIFNKLFTLTNQGGILVTYCAKGAVRRMMQEAGYTVERLAGPPGKREMLRATSK